MQVASPHPTTEKGILAEQFVVPAKPAPSSQAVTDPEDRKPWDAKDDNTLRNLVARCGRPISPWMPRQRHVPRPRIRFRRMCSHASDIEWAMKSRRGSSLR